MKTKTYPWWTAKVIQQIIAVLPASARRELRGRWHTFLAKHGHLDSNEPEFDRLRDWLRPGDVAIDVGANIGAYTLQMSQLVGPLGRVYAFEPIPQTFATLVRNLELLRVTNVTCFNAACGQNTELVNMEIPVSSNGLENLYTAHISDRTTDCRALCVRIDSLKLPGIVRLVKVDAEGFDADVLFGMRELLSTSHPRIIVEFRPPKLESMLADLGYHLVNDPNSPNVVFETATNAQA